MKITSLKINNFRSYTAASVNFSDKTNILVGKNAQGKTNLLEAIYFCSICKSPRINRDKELIKWGEDRARIQLEIEKDSGINKIDIIIDKKNKKTVKINEVPIKKIGELLGVINVVYFSPDELKLIKEAPEDRRKFLDIDISQASKTYFYNLIRYDKILNQRNKLLKSEQNHKTILDTISIWNEQLSEVASKIILSRIRFINKLAPIAQKIHSYLTNQKEILKLEYVGILGETTNEIKQKMLNELNKNFEKDLKLGFTSIGPHRDDIKISLNDVDVRLYGSQGQQRTCALSLKLSEIEIFENETGEKPVLLLDDVLSELDASRKNRLLNYINNSQTILTCTEYKSNLKDNKVIKVINGRVYS